MRRHFTPLFLVLLVLAVFVKPSSTKVYTSPHETQVADSDERVRDFLSQTQPSLFGPERLPDPGTSCYHLNYQEWNDKWDLEAVMAQMARRTDCLAVLWNFVPRNASEVPGCRIESERFFSLLVKYGFAQVYVRVWNHMPGWYFSTQCFGEGANPHIQPWCRGQTGVPPGIENNPLDNYPPSKGDIISGNLYLPHLQQCWREAHVNTPSGPKAVAQLLAERGWYVQLYNEIDFQHEWDSPPIGLFDDKDGDGYAELDDKYFGLLGHWACSLSNGFSWFLLKPNPLTRTECWSKEYGWTDCYAYDTTHLRVPFLIPPIAAVGPLTQSKAEAYIHACLDALHKGLVDNPILGGHHSVTFGPGIIALSLHSYAPCKDAGYDGAAQIVNQIDLAREIIDKWNDENKFYTPVPIVITEFGCAQVGSTPTRQQQARLYHAVTMHTINTPLAWWIGVGKQCHPPTAQASGNNRPDDWDVMAVVDIKGRACDYFSVTPADD